jgi:hypothetical protein
MIAGGKVADKRGMGENNCAFPNLELYKFKDANHHYS